MRSSSSWLVRTSLILSATLVHLVPVSAAQTVRTGSLHVFDNSNFRGWFDKGSNLGNPFLVIYSDPDGDNRPHWENQGAFSYTDDGSGGAVEMFCNGCGIQQGTSEVVDLQVGTIIGLYSGYSVWYPFASDERGSTAELRRRDLSVSVSWLVDSSAGPGNDWPVTPILRDADGIRTTQGMIINMNGACSTGLIPTTNCFVWWGPGTNPPHSVTQLSVVLTFRQTGEYVLPPPPPSPPTDSSPFMCK